MQRTKLRVLEPNVTRSSWLDQLVKELQESASLCDSAKSGKV